MAAVILHYYKSISLKTTSLHGVGTPARAVNRRPAIRKRPESWCKLGSTVALNARNNFVMTDKFDPAPKDKHATDPKQARKADKE